MADRASQRLCPRCTMLLAPVARTAADVDVCPRCGGLFLDGGELSALLPAAAGPEGWVRAGVAKPRGASALLCPAHPRTERPTMGLWAVSSGTDEVEIDACPACAGVWLDRDEESRLVALVRGLADARAGAARVARQAGEVSDEDLARFSRALRLDGMSLAVLQRGERRRPIITAVLVLANVIVSLAVVYLAHRGLPIRRVMHHLAVVPAEIIDGRGLYRLVTHAFLHAGPMHIVGNMLYLWAFGGPLEVYLGRGRFLSLYALALISAAGLHIALSPASTASMGGASGAVAGLIGAALVLMPDTATVSRRVDARIGSVVFALLFVGYQLLLPALGGRHVAFAAHLGGFFAGVLLALVLRRTLRSGTVRSRGHDLS